VPHVARGDRRAALDAGSYRTLLERVLKRTVLEQALPERMAVPEPQHLMSLAWWSARQMRPLVREGKTRFDARSFL
jgi:hypothetical protein